MKRFFLLALSFYFSAAACAHSYPTKPVKLPVGFSAGGPTDSTPAEFRGWLKAE